MNEHIATVLIAIGRKPSRLRKIRPLRRRAGGLAV
jgi:hypothetical protein